MTYSVFPSRSPSFKPVLLEGPPGLERGSRVLFETRGGERIGYVAGEGSGKATGKILSVLDTFVTGERFDLSVWVSRRYMNPPGLVFDLHYPPGLEGYVVEIVEPTSDLVGFETTTKEEFLERFGEDVLRSYMEKGLLRVSRKLRLPNVQPDPESVVFLSDFKTLFARDLTDEEMSLVEFLMREGPVRFRDLGPFPKRVVNSLTKKGILRIGKETEKKVELTEDQRRAVESIGSGGALVVGPTGSGKTEVYMELMTGKRALYLVPEASLVPQTVRRVRSRFPDLVVEAYHSYLSKARRVAVWISAVEGIVDVLVGTRSALFVPARWDLIVVDEDHDTSYYQREGVVYDAIEVAKTLSGLIRAQIVLGSATPRLEDYQEALSGKMKLVRLGKSFGGKRKVLRVDLKREKKVGSFSKTVVEAMRKTLERGKKVMVYVRRRGFGRIVCGRCGYVLKCDRCDVPLVYHSREGKFKCHVCGFEVEAFDTCPRCGGVLELVGRGTERVERELERLFPGVRVARADRDVLKRPDSVVSLLDSLARGKIDVLVGTRMISKGIDVPNVGLMVVTDMDGMLSIPDFSTVYNLFVELVQAVGRVGRVEGGTAIVQYHSIDEEILGYIEREDVEGFYRYELDRRRRFSYPPFKHLVHAVKSSRVEEMALESAEYVAKELTDTGEDVLGPSQHPVFKVRGMYRYQVVVKTDDVERTVSRLEKVLSRVGMRGWKVFVDPPTLYVH